MKKHNREMFNDGVVNVCSTEKRRIKKDIAVIRFGLRTVGVKRFYEAKISGSRVDRLISVPINNIITGSSLLIINNTQYEVEQIQEKYDTVPPAMYITLREPATAYTDERGQNDNV